MKKQILLLVMLTLSMSILRADNRSYVWTYEYMTMNKGEAEIEHYTTFSSPNKDLLDGTVTTEHNIEVEVGMTDHFDVSIYHNFKQKPREGVQYGGYKVRTRYRLGKKRQWLFDPLLYFEYKGKPDFSEHGFEFKLIAAKDIDRINISLNPVFEREYEHGIWENEIKLNAGVRYIVHPLLKAGLEFKTSESGSYVGPTVSHGKGRFWFAVGTLRNVGRVEENKPEYMTRFIMGLGI